MIERSGTDVRSLELPQDRDYLKVLASAHDQTAVLTEELAGAFRHHRSEDQVYTELLEEAQELTEAMHRFLHGKQAATVPDESATNLNQWHAPHERTTGERAAAGSGDDDSVGIVALLRHLSATVPLCRVRRQELSLMLIESTNENVLAAPDSRITQLVGQMIKQIGRNYITSGVDVLSITAAQLAVVLPDCERRQAVALANEVMVAVAGLAETDHASQAVHTVTLSAGVVTVVEDDAHGRRLGVAVGLEPIPPARCQQGAVPAALGRGQLRAAMLEICAIDLA